MWSAIPLLALGLCGALAQGDVQPFPLSAVRLAPNSILDRAASLNYEYMMSLATDDLLRTFRDTAGLPAPGQPFAGAARPCPACILSPSQK